jgi:peroxiredoxin
MDKRKRVCSAAAAVFMISVLFVHPFIAGAEETLDFSIRNVHDGSMFSMAEHKGKCLVVIFGSMHCKPCIEMIPVMNRLQENYKTSGFVAVGVDIDMGAEDEKLKSFAAEKGIRFNFLVDNNCVAKKYKVFMLPTTLVVDTSGQIMKRYTNFQSYDTLEKQVKKYLPAQTQQ